MNLEGFSLRTAGNIERNNWRTENPIMRFNFSIGRPDQTPFDGLTAGGVQAWVVDNAVPVGPRDLETTNAANSGVILMIDGSGSMGKPHGIVVHSRRQSAYSVHTARRTLQSGNASPSVRPLPAPAKPFSTRIVSASAQGERLDKLGAAKSAIGDFLDKLTPRDRVAVFAFDSSQRSIYAITDNKQAAKAAVNAFNIAYPGARYTALYNSMWFAVQKARELGARNIVFLTDGMEDTPGFRRLSTVAKVQYKRKSEQQIADLAAQSGNIRIYTIGIGNRLAKPGDMAYVDFDTLNRIANKTNAGQAHYVDLPTLARAARNSSEYHAELVKELTDILADISRSFHYDYTLTLRPQRDWLAQDGKPHKVRVECAIRQARLPVEFTYTWAEGEDSPQFGSVEVLAAFIPAVDRRIGAGSLTAIYLLFLLLLVALSTVPRIFRRIAAGKQIAIAQACVVTLDDHSPLINQQCPNERNLLGRDFLFQKGDAVVVCPVCQTPHHLGCWHMSQDTCWVRDCNHSLALTPEILQAHNLAN